VILSGVIGNSTEVTRGVIASPLSFMPVNSNGGGFGDFD
jgi:hypothetical protein